MVVVQAAVRSRGALRRLDILCGFVTVIQSGWRGKQARAVADGKRSQRAEEEQRAAAVASATMAAEQAIAMADLALKGACLTQHQATLRPLSGGPSVGDATQLSYINDQRHAFAAGLRGITGGAAATKAAGNCCDSSLSPSLSRGQKNGRCWMGMLDQQLCLLILQQHAKLDLLGHLK